MNEIEYLIIKEKTGFKVLIFMSLIFFTFSAVLNIVQGNYFGSVLFIPFIILNIIAATTFGTTYINSNEIIHKNIFGTNMIHWIDVNRIIFSNNNESIIFEGYKHQLVISGFKYSNSKNFNEILDLFKTKKEYNNVEIVDKGISILKLSKGCKVSKNTLNI